MDALWRDFVGRPTPLYRARRLGEAAGGATVYLKREDLNHTGAHKINNTLGQVLLARRMGKERIIAETGAGQHGVATATVCALFGLRVRGLHGRGGRPAPGAERLPDAPAGSRGPAGLQRHPHAQGRHQRGDPRLGDERRRHSLHHRLGGRPGPVSAHGARLPVGDRPGGAGADPGGRGTAPRRRRRVCGRRVERDGDLPPFVDDAEVELVGVEAAGEGVETGRHSATLTRASPACCTARSPTCCRTRPGRSRPRTRSRRGSTTRAWARSTPRTVTPVARSTSASPTPRRWMRSDGSRGWKGSSRRWKRRTPIAWVLREGHRWAERGPIVLCLSGRGDKDVNQVAELTTSRLSLGNEDGRTSS
jgi:tryptophan synthase beta chain